MKLKLIGADSKNGMKIIKNINKVEKQLDTKLELSKISTSDKDKYNVRVIPTLIINDKIVSEGNVISDRQLKTIIKILSQV